MHGTTGNGHSFLNNRFAGNLFNPGQLLDATKYFIIPPDAIGHGTHSNPEVWGGYLEELLEITDKK